ncbi:MAG TPA: hypothetical protein VM925_23310 [Labilithrix sp.]|nr:hypothetical protein [Labilithrix sp.]
MADPDPHSNLERLRAEHTKLFPDGFVLRLDAPPPEKFLDLPASVRQAIWRDALRFNVGARGRSGWFVSCRTRDGAPEAIFVAQRPISPERAAAWRAAVSAADWRLIGDAPRTSSRHSNGDGLVKVPGDEGIVEV